MFSDHSVIMLISKIKVTGNTLPKYIEIKQYTYI